MSNESPIVGLTASAFDMLHAGHIKMLQEAKGQCDYLIVCLHVDPSKERPEKNRPIQSVVERYIQLTGCRYVNEIIPYETEKDLIDIILTHFPDVRIVGEEYAQKDFTGRDVCIDLGIRIHYNSRVHNFSSSELRGRTST